MRHIRLLDPNRCPSLLTLNKQPIREVCTVDPTPMKSIEFDAVNPPRDPASAITEHTLYSVLLGNGHLCYFTSDRHAAQFSASIPQQLVQRLEDVVLGADGEAHGPQPVLDRAGVVAHDVAHHKVGVAQELVAKCLQRHGREGSRKGRGGWAAAPLSVHVQAAFAPTSRVMLAVVLAYTTTVRAVNSLKPSGSATKRSVWRVAMNCVLRSSAVRLMGCR